MSKSNDSIVTTAYVSLLCDLLGKQGIAIEDVLRNTGLIESQIKQPDFRFSPEQYEILADNAKHCSGDPAIGLKLGVQLQLSSHGFLGFAALSSATALESIEMAVKYVKTRTLLASLNVEIEADTAHIQVKRLAASHKSFPFVVENILPSFITIGRFLTGETELEAELDFSFPAPEYADLYSKMLNCKVRFNQPVSQIRVPLAVLKTPLASANVQSAQAALNECDKILAITNKDNNLALRIHHQFELNHDIATLEQMASQLNMTVRTINRQLALLDTSFQQILDKFRLERAKSYLMDHEYKVDHIAQLLNYRDASNFSRAFKRWTGLSPREYKKQATGQ